MKKTLLPLKGTLNLEINYKNKQERLVSQIDALVQIFLLNFLLYSYIFVWQTTDGCGLDKGEGLIFFFSYYKESSGGRQQEMVYFMAHRKTE